MSNAIVQDVIVSAPGEPRSPGVRDMLPPVVIGPALAAAVWGTMTQSWQVAQIAAVAAAASILLIGWPTIFWMLDNGRGTALVRTVAGAVLGAAPFVAAFVSGVFGLYARTNDLEYVGWALDYGPSVPYYGVILWPKFAAFVALGVACGIATLWLSHIMSRRAIPLASLPPG